MVKTTHHKILNCIIKVNIFGYLSADNSDYMRNGDFAPSRLQSQFDAVNMVALAKTKSNPENNVGLLSLAEYETSFILTHISVYFISFFDDL